MATQFVSALGLAALASNPASASAGDLYFNTGDDTVRVYDGTSWVSVGSGGGGASVAVSASAPVSPSAADLWYNSTNGALYIYYQDVDSSQWVMTTSAAGSVVSQAELDAVEALALLGL